MLERVLAVLAEVCRLGWGVGGAGIGKLQDLSGCLDCVGMQLRDGRCFISRIPAL